MSDRWDPDRAAPRLARLGQGQSEVLWADGAGFVHAHCVDFGQTWELKPIASSSATWESLTVEPADCPGHFWQVTFSDGTNPPEVIAERELSARNALWEAVFHLRHNVSIEMQQMDNAELAQQMEPPTTAEPPGIEP